MKAIATIGITAILLAAVQSEDEKLLAALVEKLSSEKPEERTDAEKKLKSQKPSSGTLLRKLAASQKDPDVKSRLDAVLRHLGTEEAKSLFAEGKLQEALLKFAEVEGAADPAKYVQEKVQKAKAEIERVGAGRAGFTDWAFNQVRALGPWAMPVLLEGLGDDVRFPRFPAGEYLSRWGAEAVPHLCEVLKSKNRQAQYNAVQAIYLAGGGTYPKLPEALERLYRDPATSDSTRAMARKTYLLVTEKDLDEKK